MISQMYISYLSVNKQSIDRVHRILLIKLSSRINTINQPTAYAPFVQRFLKNNKPCPVGFHWLPVAIYALLTKYFITKAINVEKDKVRIHNNNQVK